MGMNEERISELDREVEIVQSKARSEKKNPKRLKKKMNRASRTCGILLWNLQPNEANTLTNHSNKYISTNR